MPATVVLGLVRHILTLVGGYVFKQGGVSDDVTTELIGATMTVIGLGWSIYKNWKKE